MTHEFRYRYVMKASLALGPHLQVRVCVDNRSPPPATHTHTRILTHLCGGEHGVAPPAEPREHPGVEAEAHRPGVGGDAVLHLKLQLVQAGEVVAGRRPERHTPPRISRTESHQVVVLILHLHLGHLAFDTFIQSDLQRVHLLKEAAIYHCDKDKDRAGFKHS